MDNDIIFLLRNTYPVRGEAGAAAESWANLLALTGIDPDRQHELLTEATLRWGARLTPGEG